MSIRLVQWEDSTVTPTNDRIIYDNGYNGIIEGCAITSLGLNMLHIGDGYVRILGGLIEIVGQDIEVETSASGNKKGQLWIRLDLGSSTPVEFMTEAAATLSTLTQNAKANYENGVYEFQLCTYDISETTISNLAITAESAPSIKALFNDVVTAANESETSSTTPRDADLLGGHAPSYFATTDSLSTKANQSQVDTLNSNLAYKSDKPTLKNSILSNNQFTIDSIGKINVISGYCQVASGKCTSGLELFRLPIIPIRGYRFPMIVLRSNSTFNLMCYTGVNGEVNANHDFTFVSGDCLMINATYISKDD